MPRYFFDIFQDGQCVQDEEGTECENVEAAKYEAKLSARDLASAAVKTGLLDTETCVQVRDQEQNLVASLTIAEVLKHPNTPEFGTGCA